MKKTLIIFILLILSGCGTRPGMISSKKAKELLENNDDVILLDVREQEEYENERIKGSFLLPLAEIERNVEKNFQNKTKTYIVYCQNGRRSKIAAQKLRELGYSNVYDLGGIESWPYEKIMH